MGRTRGRECKALNRGLGAGTVLSTSGGACPGSLLREEEVLMLPDARDGQTYSIIGAAMDVHNHLGAGFLEAVYQDALAVELALRTIPFGREVPLPVLYKGNLLNCSYRADFICYNGIIVEIKAISELTSVDTAQVINYLKATGIQRALLLNFGAERLEHKRFVRDYQRASASSADRVYELPDDEYLTAVDERQ